MVKPRHFLLQVEKRAGYQSLLPHILVSLNTMNPPTPPPPEKVNQILTTLGGWDGRLSNGLLERKIAILFERLKALN